MNSDGCAWTIISADQAKYTFYEAMGPTADLPTPVPIIEQLHVNGGGETACIDITGKNFTSKLKVHFSRKAVNLTFSNRFVSAIVKPKRYVDPKRI